MNRNASIYCFVGLALCVLGGCSSSSTTTAKGPERPLDRIQGKAQVLMESTGATDAALNAGGSSVYLLQGGRRYRLFLKEPVQVMPGFEYVAEGVYAQKAIDEIGDPDQGKNGYPLEASCRRVVNMAWKNLSFDAIDANVSLVSARVKRYPARPLFLVTRISPVNSTEKTEKKEAAAEGEVPEVTVPAEKQAALLTEGKTVQTAPMWSPNGGTVQCKLLIGPDGKVSELETGIQLCETVDWSQFQWKPALQAGHPVKVHTEVEVRFEPRK